MSDFTLEYTKENVSYLNSLGIDIFDPNRKYWFLRTNGGEYYNAFSEENFIGIAWNEVSNLAFIKNSTNDELKEYLKTVYPNDESPGYKAGRLKEFVCNMHKGDIVLIPSENSEYIKFGELVDEDVYIYEEDEEEKFLNTLESLVSETDAKEVIKKRRHIKWLKTLKRSEIDVALHKIIYYQGTLTDITPECDVIDRTLSKFYLKGNSGSFTYMVNKRENISYNQMRKFLNHNYEIMEDITKLLPFPINLENVILKVNVQSRGPAQIKGAALVILCVGLGILAIFGGKFSAWGVSIETEGLPGLIETLKSSPQNISQKHIEQLNESIQNLEISLPEN